MVRRVPDARSPLHHYFDIDLDILWSTVTGDLPPLLNQLRDIDDGSSR